MARREAFSWAKSPKNGKKGILAGLENRETRQLAVFGKAFPMCEKSYSTQHNSTF